MLRVMSNDRVLDLELEIIATVPIEVQPAKMTEPTIRIVCYRSAGDVWIRVSELSDVIGRKRNCRTRAGV